MNYFQKIEKGHYDIIIYSILIFFYGLGWDFVDDEHLDLWSIIGIVSYTIFVLLLLVKRQRLPDDPEASGRISVWSQRSDLIGKIILGVILYGLLLFRLITGLKT